jgi:hypothetical protein
MAQRSSCLQFILYTHRVYKFIFKLKRNFTISEDLENIATEVDFFGPQAKYFSSRVAVLGRLEHVVRTHR